MAERCDGVKMRRNKDTDRQCSACLNMQARQMYDIKLGIVVVTVCPDCALELATKLIKVGKEDFNGV